MEIPSGDCSTCVSHIERAVRWLLLNHPTTYVFGLARTSRRAGSLDPGRAPGRPPMSCCPPNYLGLTQLGRPINLKIRHAAPQGANAGFVIACHSSGLSRTAATLVTIASAASATAPALLGRPINLVLRHAAPQISRPTGPMLPPQPPLRHAAMTLERAVRWFL